MRCGSESPKDLFTFEFGGSYNWAVVVIYVTRYSLDRRVSIILPQACVLTICQMKFTPVNHMFLCRLLVIGNRSSIRSGFFHPMM